LKRLLFLFLLIPIIFLSSCTNDGRSNVDKISFVSRLLDKEMTVQVYKPPSYSTNISYPVLYFIADYGGSSYTVMNEYNVPDTADKMISDEKIFPLLIVGVSMDRSFGLDSSINTSSYTTETGKTFNTGMYQSYFTDEIIPLIESSYNVIKEKEGRYIGGYSMGGFAAIYIAFTRPELFSKVGGHSPSIFIEDFPDKTVSDWLYPDIETRMKRDPIYIVQNKTIEGLKVFLDVEIGGSEGVKYLFGILVKKDIDSEFIELGLSHGRMTCSENMDEYLKFYASKE
jgi:enterochelin esterase-like enzyme